MKRSFLKVYRSSLDSPSLGPSRVSCIRDWSAVEYWFPGVSQPRSARCRWPPGRRAPGGSEGSIGGTPAALPELPELPLPPSLPEEAIDDELRALVRVEPVLELRKGLLLVSGSCSKNIRNYISQF